MGHFEKSGNIVEESRDILINEPSTLLFPIIGTFFSISIVVVFSLSYLILDPNLVPAIKEFLYLLAMRTNGLDEEARSLLAAKMTFDFLWQHKIMLLGILLAHFYSSLVFIYMASCIVAMASLRIKGQDPTFRDGFALATERFNQILSWTIVVALFGFLLTILDAIFKSKNNLAGIISTALLGFAWNLASLLVIPIIIIDGSGPIEALKRSSNLFKETWVVELWGSLRYGWQYLINSFIIVALIIISFFIPVSIEIHIFLICLGVLAIIYLNLKLSVLKLIFRTVLYDHVTNTDKNSPTEARAIRFNDAMRKIYGP